MAWRVSWIHEWDDRLDLAEEWESIAPDWIKWARAPGFDSYWRCHRDRFLESLPAPPRTVLDMGCCEGRLPCDLTRRGYQVSGVDASPTLVAAALDMDPDGTYRVATAADTGFPDASFDMVVALNSLHDAAYCLEGPYLLERKYADDFQDGEYHMRFASAHRPFGAYFDALERHGLLTERVREVGDGSPSPKLQPGQRYLGVPLFLHVRAVKHSVA